MENNLALRRRAKRRDYKAAHNRVITIHHPHVVQGISEACSDGRCEHGIEKGQDNLSWDDCPEVDICVCNECFHIAHPDGMFDDLLDPDLVFPCKTWIAANPESEL